MKRLVRTILSRGAVVAYLISERVEEIYSVRASLEKAAAGLFIINIRKEDIQERKKSLKGLEENMRKKSGRRFEKDSEFHQTIFRVCRYQCLTGMIDLLHTKAHTVRYNAWFLPQRIDQSIHGHGEIIRYIEIRDCSQLEKLILKDLKFSKNAYPVRGK
jgi:DNA-binding GntR family transcriptional regulator